MGVQTPLHGRDINDNFLEQHKQGQAFKRMKHSIPDPSPDNAVSVLDVLSTALCCIFLTI